MPCPTPGCRNGVGLDVVAVVHTGEKEVLVHPDHAGESAPPHKTLYLERARSLHQDPAGGTSTMYVWIERGSGDATEEG